MVSPETLSQIMSRLKVLGYDCDRHNIADLEFWANLVYDAVTSDLCRKTIPPPLWRVYIDMVCGEFLYDQYINGNLDDWFADDVPRGDITRVSLGDMEVHFNGMETERDIFLANVGYLREHPDFRYLFDIYRNYIP